MPDSRKSFGLYLAGGALAFGVILIAIQILGLFVASTDQVELQVYGPALYSVWLSSHTRGGVLGGFLVSRRRGRDYILTGTVVAVLAYIFEFVYRNFIEGISTGMASFFSYS